MDEKRSNGVWWAVAVLAAIPCAYIACYFGLGKTEDVQGNTYRVFPLRTVAILFVPLATVETLATDRLVVADYRHDAWDAEK
jgi:hypothetical protein